MQGSGSGSMPAPAIYSCNHLSPCPLDGTRQVRLPDGTITPALAPFVSLLNHSPWPHIVR